MALEYTTNRFLRLTLRSLTAAVLLVCALALPSAAPANNVGNAASTPDLGGGVPLLIPGDGHQVYRLKLTAKDWVIAYAWAPGTLRAAATVRLLGPSATDVASPTVAVSGSGGVLCYQALATGTYFVDFAAAAGTHVSRGLFLSRSTLTLRGSHTVVIPYNTAVTPSCNFTDPLYNYVAYDGPAVAFEGVSMSSSSDGVHYKQLWAGPSNVKGLVAHPASHLTKRTRIFFGYSGQLYDTAAFGPARSDILTVYPRVKFSLKAPSSPSHGVPFTVTGSVEPKCSPGSTTVVVQAVRTGSPSLSFACRASASSGSATPLRASVTLPLAGAWSVRLYRPTDSNNAETATKWVHVNVR